MPFTVSNSPDFFACSLQPTWGAGELNWIEMQKKKKYTKKTMLKTFLFQPHNHVSLSTDHSNADSLHDIFTFAVRTTNGTETDEGPLALEKSSQWFVGFSCIVFLRSSSSLSFFLLVWVYVLLLVVFVCFSIRTSAKNPAWVSLEFEILSTIRVYKLYTSSQRHIILLFMVWTISISSSLVNPHHFDISRFPWFMGCKH
jgi:hypothetical protein